jgi:hypothetical protein
MQQRDSSNRHYRVWSCLVLLVAHGYAQERPLASLAGTALTLAVTADIAQRCANTITAPLTQDVAAQLRQANLNVAKIHNAELTTTVDCAPMRGHNQRAVQYCVGLSQVTSVPTAPRSHTLTTTWRQCGATNCTRRTCDAQLRDDVHHLVTAFINDLQDASKRTASNPAPRPAILAPAHAPTQAHTDNAGSRNPMTDLTLPITRAGVIYLLYIITCLGVLLQWEYRRHQVYWKH